MSYYEISRDVLVGVEIKVFPQVVLSEVDSLIRLSSSRGVHKIMHYTPDVKALVYNEINFVSTSVPMSQVKVSYDVDALFDEVSVEVFRMFVGEVSEQMVLPVVRQAQTV